MTQRFEVAYILGCQALVRHTDVRIEREHKCVFDIELELVDLKCGQPIHQHLQRVERGHSTTGHVVEQTTRGEIRPVGNHAAVHAPAIEARQLGEGL